MTDNSLIFYRKVRDYLTIYLPNQRGASPNTVKAYKEALNKLIDYLVLQGTPMDKVSFTCISRDAVDGFLDWLERNQNYSISSRNQRLAAVKSFLKYSAKRDKTLMALYLEVSAVTKKKETSAHEIEFFSETALEVILKQPDQNRKTGQRNLVIMILMYDTGGRVQEILDLRLSNINLVGENPFIIVAGKGRKTRSVPIMKKTRDHLDNMK